MTITDLQHPVATKPRASEHHHPKPLPGRESKHPSWGQAALRSETRKLSEDAGAGRHQLYTAAMKMGNLCGSGELSATRVEDVLVTVGVSIGLSRSTARKAVQDGLVKGMESPRSAPEWRTLRCREDAIVAAVEWWESIDLDEFKGTTGSTELRLHAGAVLAMINAGKVEFGWSVRQAEADSGLGRHTVWRLMKPGGDVERRGYLKPVRRSRPGAHHADQPDKASTWRCVARRGKARQAPSAVHSASGLSRKTASLPTSPALNLFHRQANAWHIDQRLQEGEQVTVKELVTELGVIPDTVRRALRYLESHGLARRVNRTEWEGTATRADADAPARDGVDHQAKRCERHRTERKKFKDWCAARRAAREEQAERLDAERSQRIEEAWEGMTPTFDEVTGRPIETRPDRPDVDPETGELLEVAA